MLSRECVLVLAKFIGYARFSFADVEELLGNHDLAVNVMYYLETGRYINTFALPGKWYKVSELGKGYLENMSAQKNTSIYALIAAIGTILTLIATVLMLVLQLAK